MITLHPEAVIYSNPAFQSVGVVRRPGQQVIAPATTAFNPGYRPVAAPVQQVAAPVQAVRPIAQPIVQPIAQPIRPMVQPIAQPIVGAGGYDQEIEFQRNRQYDSRHNAYGPGGIGANVYNTSPGRGSLRGSYDGYGPRGPGYGDPRVGGYGPDYDMRGSGYGPGDYDRYGPDYGRGGYDRDRYGPDYDRYGRGGYDRGGYDRGGYDRDRYGRGRSYDREYIDRDGDGYIDGYRDRPRISTGRASDSYRSRYDNRGG